MIPHNGVLIGGTFIITGYFLAKFDKVYNNLPFAKARPPLHAHAKMGSRIKGASSQEEPPIPLPRGENP